MWPELDRVKNVPAPWTRHVPTPPSHTPSSGLSLELITLPPCHTVRDRGQKELPPLALAAGGAGPSLEGVGVVDLASPHLPHFLL